MGSPDADYDRDPDQWPVFVVEQKNTIRRSRIYSAIVGRRFDGRFEHVCVKGKRLSARTADTGCARSAIRDHAARPSGRVASG